MAASDMDDAEFDGFLMNIAERKRGIDPMLDVVFGFLRRRTDFFKGANPPDSRATSLPHGLWGGKGYGNPARSFCSVVAGRFSTPRC